MQFAENELLAEMERKAVQNGLEFTEELAFENGAIYKGYLQSGLREGPGTQQWPDGARYVGEWHSNKANG